MTSDGNLLCGRLSVSRNRGRVGSSAHARNVLALRYPDVGHPVSWVAAVQTAFLIPRPLDAVQLAVSQVTLLIHATLIFIQPPLEPVPFSLFEIAGFGQIREPAFGTLQPPEINARTVP